MFEYHEVSIINNNNNNNNITIIIINIIIIANEKCRKFGFSLNSLYPTHCFSFSLLSLLVLNTKIKYFQTISHVGVTGQA